MKKELNFHKIHKPTPFQAVEAAVNYCADKVKEMPGPKDGPAPPCSFTPMFLTGCVYGQIYKACGSQIVAKDECTKLSEFAKKCDWVPPMKCKMGEDGSSGN
jgi:hypothetical protein